jgi:hypothetical protein
LSGLHKSRCARRPKGTKALEFFPDYRKADKDRLVLTTHMFRKRAFTMAWQKGINPRREAIGYGCNVETLMGHYAATDEQQVTDEVFAAMNGGEKG